MLTYSQFFPAAQTRFVGRAGLLRRVDVSACAWESGFQTRPPLARNEIRIQITRKCRSSGLSFERVWSNTGRFVGSALLGSLRARNKNIRVAELCADRIAKLLSSAEQLSDSYNKLLIRASAEYCLHVIKKLNEELPEHQTLLTEIRRLTLQEQDLLSQYSGDRGDLGLLDLQLFDDKFMRVQEESEKLGIFPRLSQIPIDQLFTE